MTIRQYTKLAEAYFNILIVAARAYDIDALENLEGWYDLYNLGDNDPLEGKDITVAIENNLHILVPVKATILRTKSI